MQRFTQFGFIPHQRRVENCFCTSSKPEHQSHAYYKFASNNHHVIPLKFTTKDLRPSTPPALIRSGSLSSLLLFCGPNTCVGCIKCAVERKDKNSCRRVDVNLTKQVTCLHKKTTSRPYIGHNESFAYFLTCMQTQIPCTRRMCVALLTYSYTAGCC